MRMVVVAARSEGRSTSRSRQRRRGRRRSRRHGDCLSLPFLTILEILDPFFQNNDGLSFFHLSELGFRCLHTRLPMEPNELNEPIDQSVNQIGR